MYRYTKEGNINELRHNSMYGYENNRNSLVYRYTRTAPGLSLRETSTGIYHARGNMKTFKIKKLMVKLAQINGKAPIHCIVAVSQSPRAINL